MESIVIRLPPGLRHRLKVKVAIEGLTIQAAVAELITDYCLDVSFVTAAPTVLSSATPQAEPRGSVTEEEARRIAGVISNPELDATLRDAGIFDPQLQSEQSEEGEDDFDALLKQV